MLFGGTQAARVVRVGRSSFVVLVFGQAVEQVVFQFVRARRVCGRVGIGLAVAAAVVGVLAGVALDGLFLDPGQFIVSECAVGGSSALLTRDVAKQIVAVRLAPAVRMIDPGNLRKRAHRFLHRVRLAGVRNGVGFAAALDVVCVSWCVRCHTILL